MQILWFSQEKQQNGEMALKCVLEGDKKRHDPPETFKTECFWKRCDECRLDKGCMHFYNVCLMACGCFFFFLLQLLAFYSRSCFCLPGMKTLVGRCWCKKQQGLCGPLTGLLDSLLFLWCPHPYPSRMKLLLCTHLDIYIYTHTHSCFLLFSILSRKNKPETLFIESDSHIVCTYDWLIKNPSPTALGQCQSLSEWWLSSMLLA